MVEKINDVLFHPSTLIRFRFTHLIKVLLVLFVLSTFSILVPIIDIIKSPELTMADKSKIELTTGFDFDIASDLPNCSVENNEYTCTDDSSKQKKIASLLGVITIVSDVDDDMTKSNSYYFIKLTKDKLIVQDLTGFRHVFSYDKLPKAWQTFDFEEIKSQQNPSDSLYLFFIDGFNEILIKLTPLILIMNIFVSFFIKLLEILFYSLLFFMLYRRYQFRFKELFKITVFAHTLPIILGVMFNLMRINLGGFIPISITFIYVSIAVLSSIPKNQEF